MKRPMPQRRKSEGQPQDRAYPVCTRIFMGNLLNCPTNDYTLVLGIL